MSFFSSSGVLIDAHPLQHEQRVGDLGCRRTRSCSALPASTGRNDSSAPMPRVLMPGFLMCSIAFCMVSTRARRIALLHRRPERIVLALEVLQAMAEIGGLVGRALGVDQYRQIAATAPSHPCSRRRTRGARRAGTARCAWRWRSARPCRPRPSACRGGRCRTESWLGTGVTLSSMGTLLGSAAF